MNYRHAYHAGNHADVLKHIVLARVIERFKRKDKPFLVLDAHAGAGLYALDGPEAAKTGEWREGIGRLWNVPFEAGVESLIGPWRQAVASVNPGGTLRRYPGSPEFARLALRAHDRLVANELHPHDGALLGAHLASCPFARVTAVDAKVAIKAHLPPPERRGLILIDPPYEEPDESARAARMLRQGLRRFASGVFCLWYPITGGDVAERLAAALGGFLAQPTLRAELKVRGPSPQGGLAGSGLILINPPWQLDEDLRVVLPHLAQRLARDEGAKSSVAWIVR